MLLLVQTPMSSRLLSKNLKIKIYKTIILPVVLYGCETWSLTLREEYKLRVFENRILRRIFETESDENGEWRMLHNEERRSLCRSPNIVKVVKYRRLKWAGHISRMEQVRNSLKILTGKLIGTSRHKLQNLPRVDVIETCINTRNCVDSTQDRDYYRALVIAALNLRVP